MDIQYIDHFTIRSRPQDVEALRDFYGNVLGLRPGLRPDFSFLGYWMHLGDRPVVHIAGSLPVDGPIASKGLSPSNRIGIKESGVRRERNERTRNPA
jgi:catechol 2,3-dioxygenase-like lactoylglutathione lyase family enzyme